MRIAACLVATLASGCSQPDNPMIDGRRVSLLIEAEGEPVGSAFASVEEFAHLVADWPLRRLTGVSANLSFLRCCLATWQIARRASLLLPVMPAR